MKKLIYISGILSANLFLFGSIFKMQHWPLANVLLTLAVIAFCAFFLPASLISNYQSSGTKKHGLLLITTFIVFAMGVISIYFKVLHLPYSNILLYAALPLPFVFFLPVYLYETRSENKNNFSFVPVILGLTFIAVFSVLLAGQ